MSEDAPADPERVIGIYRRHAAAFDRQRTRLLHERSWLDRFRALLPATQPRVLDIGCGMAEPIARYLAEIGCAITGVDSSPAMIALCRERLPTHEWILADMRGLALGRAFDGILAWDSFFFLPHNEQRRMFATFGGHAVTGSALMFTSGPSDGEAVGNFEGEPLYHASLAAEEYRALLTQHGFRVVDHCANDPECSGHTVWLARRDDA